jgi:nitroreductase
MQLREVMGRRRSIRFLLPHKPVEPEKIQRMLEAARIAVPLVTMATLFWMPVSS